ncbi:hypothetical protein NMY22_g6646 [Coprinellus aureogranulatus]|nr:hypothetical protein NMY22_g6646 [Coprinellus aureogranulatus]
MPQSDSLDPIRPRSSLTNTASRSRRASSPCSSSSSSEYDSSPSRSPSPASSLASASSESTDGSALPYSRPSSPVPSRCRSSSTNLPSTSAKACSYGPTRGPWPPLRQDYQDFCRIHTLITNGLSRAMQIELGRLSESDLSQTELSEHGLYCSLLKLSPGLEERLNTGTEQELHYVADMLTKGVSSARSDDTKSLKAAVVDWITPQNQVLSPPIQRNVKTDRGFHHPRTGELLCPVNLDWNDEKIRRDLTCGQLVPIRGSVASLYLSAYKHVFTSPSSVHGGANKATRSSNARIHGMTAVTIPSIAYIATQVRFALNDSPSFSRTDLVTDSEYFYNLIIDLLEDESEKEEVGDLLKWWNQQIFPAQIQHNRTVDGDSVIAKIKERRRLIDAGLWNARQGASHVDAARKDLATPTTST